MIAHCNLSTWVEAKPLYTLFSWAVTHFLYEVVICSHGYFGKWIINRGSENKNAIIDLALRYGVKNVMVSVYY